MKSCFSTIICEQKLNQTVNTRDCERSEAGVPKASLRSADKLLLQFTLGPYELYVIQVWKYIIAICLLVLRRGILIRCAILVVNIFWNSYVCDSWCNALLQPPPPYCNLLFSLIILWIDLFAPQKLKTCVIINNKSFDTRNFLNMPL